MHTLCHHIMLSTSTETADLSVSLHNWGAVGIKDVTLRGMRKCYPRPPTADQRNRLKWEPQTGCIHRPETADSLPHRLWSQRPVTYMWLMRALHYKVTEIHIKRGTGSSRRIKYVKGWGQFCLVWDTLGNGLRFSSWVGNETKLITDGSINWLVNKSPLLSNQN